MPKELIIVKLDAIGDYIIFRNFIESIKKSEKFRDYDITLVGNVVWKDLALKYDAGYVKKFIFFGKEDLKSVDKLIDSHPELFEKNFDTLIHPTFSRIGYVDNLVKNINANEKIGYLSDNSNQNNRQLKVTNAYYTKLIETPKGKLHEFKRHICFFRTLLEEDIETHISLDYKKNNTSKYAVIFPGASSIFKRWSPNKFKKVATYLHEKYYFNIIICGSKDDKVISDRITKNSNITIKDLTGKTDLAELVDIIGNASILVTNDTSALHIAVATKTDTILISSGHHKDRFSKYDLKSVKEIYPPFYIQRWHGFINLIGVKKVIQKLDKLIFSQR